MEHGVVVTKYDTKGAATQRVLFLDVASMSVAWRDLDARPSSPGHGTPGHRRSLSFTSLLKGKKGALELLQLMDVRYRQASFWFRSWLYILEFYCC